MPQKSVRMIQFYERRNISVIFLWYHVILSQYMVKRVVSCKKNRTRRRPSKVSNDYQCQLYFKYDFELNIKIFGDTTIELMRENWRKLKNYWENLNFKKLKFVVSHLICAGWKKGLEFFLNLSSAIMTHSLNHRNQTFQIYINIQQYTLLI